ncbi:MAG: P27 family phage terminase small subunit, partial [Candidatus Omnitrophica bacterium]|nr:P27 family phage terminase small subunit [Candidatus Omnitrophota bacterium]
SDFFERCSVDDFTIGASMPRGGARLNTGPKPKIGSIAKAHAANNSAALIAPQPCPRWLGKDKLAKATWSWVTKCLAENNLLTAADFAVIEQFCFASAIVKRLEKELIDGEEFDVKKSEQINKYMTQIRQFSAMLGLDPRNRANLKGPVGPKQDDFTKFL